MTLPCAYASPARQRGVGLVETMIALVLGLVVIGAATSIYLSNKQAYITNDALAEVQDNARIAYELLARDIRQAGATGCGDLLKMLPDDTSHWYQDFSGSSYGLHGFSDVGTDTAVAGGVAGTNSLRVIGVSTWSGTVNTVNSATSFTLTESGLNFNVGDLLVVCEPDHISLAQATGYVSPTLGLTGTLLNTFHPNALVSRLAASDWYIGTNPQGTRSLYRQTLTTTGGAPATETQEMVRNVTDMQIIYGTPAHSNFISADSVANWTTVNAVHIDLTLSGTATGSGTDQTPITRHLTGTITLRNRV
ncbi:MAG: prepilin-type cleavage/methylation domain-containing protein [Nevskiaceae bacterium]|nr:MAG: prepilin-type cleavage/methylation domain-containing protein [Nevskiaceae bacterium]TBR74892.1 MAG: prepilin-type cleavage/methylation domain-containing protein [Nevskiaceae bacterium]